MARKITSLFLLFAMIVYAPVTVMAASEPGTMNVSASAEIRAVPDMAVFQIGVDTRAETLEEARRANAVAMEGVRERLTAAGAREENVKTRGFQVYPEWHYDSDRAVRTLIGYRVTHTLEVIVTDLDVLGDWLDAAMEEGANQISGPTFGLSDTEQLEAQALQEAVRKARAKADVLAQASGVFIKRIRHINAHVNTPYGGAIQARMSVQMDAVPEGASTSISPGEISVTANVSITYEI